MINAERTVLCVWQEKGEDTMYQPVTDKIDWFRETRGDRLGVISYLFIGSTIKYHIKIFEALLLWDHRPYQ